MVIRLKNFKFTCTCGQIVIVQADSKEEALLKLMEVVDTDLVKHMSEKHPGEPIPPVRNAKEYVDEHTVEVIEE